MPTDLDDAALLAFARAHDREEAAQRGEPDPWPKHGTTPTQEDVQFAQERLAAVRVGFAALSALSPPCDGVGVKELQWPDSIRRGQRVQSSGGLLTYTIAHYGGSEPDSGVVYRWGVAEGPWSEAFFAYEHAIAAAQSDYDRRIRSALAPVAVEPVAWRWRWPHGVWSYQEAKQVIPGVEAMEPLYASPAPAAVDTGTLEHLGELIYRALYEHKGGRWDAVETKYVWTDAGARLRALIAGGA